MNKTRAKELSRFIGVGLVGTIMDYLTLNLLAVWFGVPIILANLISAPGSSYVGYKLNKRVVFVDRMHGEKKTLFLYTAIVGSGIVILQNLVIYLVHGDIAHGTASFLDPALELFGLGNINRDVVAVNVAKAMGSFVSFLWNYALLRRFVFVTKEEDGK